MILDTPQSDPGRTPARRAERGSMPRLPRPTLLSLCLMAVAASLALLSLADRAAAAAPAAGERAAQGAAVSTQASPGLIAVVMLMTLAMFAVAAAGLLRVRDESSPGGA